METREDKILSLVPLVQRIVGGMLKTQHIPSGYRDDMISDGVWGLIKAVDGYDPEYGVPIHQYARIRIKGEILDGIRRILRGIETTETPDGERFNNAPVSLEMLRETYWDIEDPRDDFRTLEGRLALPAVLDKLPHHHRQILSLHAQGMTDNQIGKAIGVSNHTAKKRRVQAVDTAQRVAGVTRSPIMKNVVR